MRFLKKLIPLILAVCATLGALTSCDRDYDEQEVLRETEVLIKKSAILEDIIFGKGFDYHVDTTEAYQKANEADVKKYSDALSKYGESFTTFDELVSIIPKVYTQGRTSSIMSGALSGDLNYYTRYYQEKEDIMVLTTYTPQKTDKVDYLFDTLRVSDVVEEKIKLTISAVITRSYKEDGEEKEKTQTVELEVTVIEESEGWRLASPTFAVYNENYQSYKDLENELNNRKS